MCIRDRVKAVAKELALAIWTTTPWTIPANAAVAVNSDLVYAVAEVLEPKEGARKYLVVAKDLVESLQAKVGSPLKVVAEAKGSAFEGS
eukprot:5571235-Pyramimonas_sp.AAC.1